MRSGGQSFDSGRLRKQGAAASETRGQSFDSSRSPSKRREQLERANSASSLEGGSSIESGGSGSATPSEESFSRTPDRGRGGAPPLNGKGSDSPRLTALHAVEAELERDAVSDHKPPANPKTWLLPGQQGGGGVDGCTPNGTRRRGSVGSSVGAVMRRGSFSGVSTGSAAKHQASSSSVALEQAGSALLGFLERPLPLLPQQRLEALWAICRSFAPLVKAESAAIYKVDKPAGQLVIDPNAGGLGMRAQVLPLLGIVGTAVNTVEPVLVADVTKDARFDASVDHVLDPARALVALPIMCSSRGVAAGSVGFIATYGRPEAGEWGADQLVLLQAASHAMHACMEQWHNAQQQRRAEDEAHRLREKLQQKREDVEGQSTQLAQLNAAHDCMMDLAKQMGSEGMDSIMVLKDTVTSFKKLLNCDRCSVFKLDKEQGTLELHSNELDSVIIMPIGAGIAGHVGQSGELVNIPDAYADSRFNQAIDKQTGYRTKSILCAPICGMDGTVLAVVQLINKFNDECVFTQEDNRFLTKLSAQMGTHLHNAMFFDQYTEDRVRMRALLRMAKRVTPAEQDTVSALRTTVQEFKRIVDSERCSVYACLPEQETMVLYTDLMEGWTAPIAMPISVGIAGMVAATGKLINVKDAYADERFNRDVDRRTGFRTKTMLVCPIKSADRDKRVIAVAQLINKTDGCFTRDDEITMTHACEIVASSLQNMLLRAS